MELGKKVKELRKRRGWTQEDLAPRCGFKDKSSIGRIEAGLWEPELKVILKLSQALECSPIELLGWDSPTGIPGEVVSVMHMMDEDRQRKVLSYAKYLLSEGGESDGV